VGIEVEEGQELEDTELETESTEEEPKSGKIETVRETVVKAIQENAKNKADTGDKGVESNDPEPAEKVTEKTAAKADTGPDLAPPARFDAAAKQAFDKLPKHLKQVVSKTVRDLEGLTTRTQQEIAPLRKKYERIDELIRPHRAEWAQAGLTDDQAIAELVATHEKLKNPKTKEQTYRWLAHNTGLSHLLKEEGAAATETAQPEYVRQLEQQVATLQQQIAPVLQNHQQFVSQAEAREVGTARQEVEAVQNEKDSSGRYRYPNLHDPQFVEQIKPLVIEAVRNVPNLGYGQALRRVYEMYAQPVGTSPVQSQSLPANARAFTAGVSVRGRSAPPQGMASEPEIPKAARGSVRDTVAWVIANRGRGA
jgi:hypothetical protein